MIKRRYGRDVGKIGQERERKRGEETVSKGEKERKDEERPNQREKGDDKRAKKRQMKGADERVY